MRSAFLRPGGLLVAVTGAAFFALTLAWWVIPITLVTYAVLVFLAARGPLFENGALDGRERRPLQTRSVPPKEGAVSPERRARWLPRGETRRKVEEALELYRRTVSAIEESGDVTRAVLDDALPKLHRVAERLVDVAEKREKAAEVIQALKSRSSPAGSPSSSAGRREDRTAELEGLEKELRAADAEISDTFEKLSTLRARVVRASIESEVATPEAAVKLNADLDELNLRLDALRSTMSPE